MESIRPSQETREAVESLADNLVSEIQGILDGIISGCKVEIEGSVAKGTYLEDQHDIDVFAFFPVGTSRKVLEKTILALGRKWAESRGASYRIAYAEHPYVTVSLEHMGATFEVDVVGAYLVESTKDMISAVDRTRFHTEYVKGRMEPDLRDQILLTKQFMKGTGVYGSEVRVGGFSGLLCEVLTIAHGSFLSLLEEARNWRSGHVVDLENLNSSASQDFDAPLIVIDPTDGQRNAGASVSLDKMTRFIHAARTFLRKPSEKFFFPNSRRPFSRSELRRILGRRGTQILVLAFQKPDVIDDIAYPQVERMTAALRGQLEEHGFSLAGPSTGNVCEEDGVIFVLFELGIFSLPHIEKRYGPTIDRIDHSKRFLKKHEKAHPYIEGDRWCVDAPRRFSEARDLLHFILSKNPQGILPSHVARALESGWSLKSGEEAIRGAGPALRLLLTEHLVSVFPWEV